MACPLRSKSEQHKKESFCILLVPTIPGELRVDVISEGILISWNKSSVQHGSIRYQLTGLENGVKREFCSDCGLNYLINMSEPNMNYSFWVVAHNNRNGYVSLASSIVQFHTARRSKYLIYCSVRWIIL
jgi:hypothetical protein